jgi:membrane protease YdiL (CAAX protease family)
MMNETKVLCRRLRGEYSKVGWALLIYYAIMNVAIIFSSFYVSILATTDHMLTDPFISVDDMERMLQQITEDSIWGYTIAVMIGAVALLLWKRKTFCFDVIYQVQKPMRFGTFLALLAIFISGQALFQLLTPLMEWLFKQMGVSLEDSITSASGDSDVLSMFLYVTLLAPIWEEVLFRGYVMRTLEPYGKKFAIFASAFLFGIFHGNVVQSPYAFAVGLVLGYVAMEYSVIWAMVLHMINNLVLGDLLYRLLAGLPQDTVDMIAWGIICAFSVAAVILMVVRRKEIAAWLRREPIDRVYAGCYFSCPGTIALLIVLGATTLFTTWSMIVPL